MVRNEINNWELMFVLANIKTDHPIEGKHIAIVPYEDERVQTLIDNSIYVNNFLNGFIDTFSQKTRPATLIIEAGIFDRPYNVEIIVNFRNIIAVCNLCYAWSLIYSSGTPRTPMFSDSYDFYPVTLMKDGALINTNLAQTSFSSINSPFVGMSDKNIPFMTINDYSHDDELKEPMLTLWKEKYVDRIVDLTFDTALFRSLETVYTAMSLPKKNFASIYEIGVHISLYVSAIEILANPQNADVKQTDVLSLLGAYKWGHRALDINEHKIDFSQKNSCYSNLIGSIYKKLYDSRNLFLHGSIIKPDILKPFGTDKFSIYELAPIVYRTALFSYLVKCGYLDTDRKVANYDEYLTFYFSKNICNTNYKNVLLTLLNLYDDSMMDSDENI